MRKAQQRLIYQTPLMQNRKNRGKLVSLRVVVNYFLKNAL